MIFSCEPTTIIFHKGIFYGLQTSRRWLIITTAALTTVQAAVSEEGSAVGCLGASGFSVASMLCFWTYRHKLMLQQCSHWHTTLSDTTVTRTITEIQATACSSWSTTDFNEEQIEYLFMLHFSSLILIVYAHKFDQAHDKWHNNGWK